MKEAFGVISMKVWYQLDVRMASIWSTDRVGKRG
jgi:hypothetical protein